MDRRNSFLDDSKPKKSPGGKKNGTGGGAQRQPKPATGPKDPRMGKPQKPVPRVQSQTPNKPPAGRVPPRKASPQPQEGHMPPPSKAGMPRQNITGQQPLRKAKPPVQQNIATNRKNFQNRGDIAYFKTPQKPPPAPPREKRRISGRAVALVLFTVLFLGACGFFGFKLLRVRHIQVEGISGDVKASYVVQLSQMKKGTHIFNVDRQKIEAAIAADPYLRLEEFAYTFPDSVTLKIHQRVPRCYFEFSGTYLICDREGNVLEQAAAQPSGLWSISGLNITRFDIGYAVRTDDTYKQDVFQEIMGQLDGVEIEGGIAGVNMRDVNNICVSTGNGMEIYFGGKEKFSEKLALVRGVLTELSAEGKTAGRIQVVSENQATYSQSDAPPADTAEPDAPQDTPVPTASPSPEPQQG